MMALNCMIMEHCNLHYKILQCSKCLILFHWSRYSSSVLRSFEASESQLQIKHASFLTLGRVDAGFLKQELCPSHSKAQAQGWELPVSVMLHQTARGLILRYPEHGLTNTLAALVISLGWCPNVKVDLPSIGFLAWRRIKLDTSFQYQRTRRPFSTWYCGRMPKLALSYAVLSLVSQLSSFRLIQHPEQFPSDNMMLSLHLCT